MTFQHVFPAIALTLLLASGAGAQKLDVRVDPRVELLSIVFRLAGHPEYNMPNSRSPYSEAVEVRFGGHRNHPAVEMARELRTRRGISYDAVMSLAVHLESDLSPPRLRVPLDPRPPLLEGRWTSQDASAFVEALSSFVADTQFLEFVERQKDRYSKAAELVEKVVNTREYIPWFDNFFGQRPQGRFVVIVGMLTGGQNYGVSMRYPDGREEITPVIGIHKWDVLGNPAIGQEIVPTLVHELCHAYTNALVDEHIDVLQKAGDELFARNAAIMRQQAYGDGRTVLYETLVRAVVSHHARTQLGTRAGMGQVIEEMARGFKWTRGLADLLREYESNRGRYRTFSDFMPRVVEFLNHTVENYDQLVAKFPRVVAMEPVNGAALVDPTTTRRIVITFSRPMMKDSYSLIGGGPRFPRFGRPSFDLARTTLTVPVALEPGKVYEFGLNSMQYLGFVSEDGYPLEPMLVRFSTR